MAAQSPEDTHLIVKRTMDVVLAAFALVVLSPIILLLAGLVRLRMGRRIIFKQVRPGRGGQPFTLLKFRTMREVVDRQGNPLPDEHRLTALGRLLRRTSLDELPELWNVLRGDMSLVGPRPLLMEYLDRYSPKQASRHELRPGITGLAQVSGRNALSWEERLELDTWYVENQSLSLDLRILARTLWEVVTMRGINAPGHATMPTFDGNPGG